MNNELKLRNEVKMKNKRSLALENELKLRTEVKLLEILSPLEELEKRALYTANAGGDPILMGRAKALPGMRRMAAENAERAISHLITEIEEVILLADHQMSGKLPEPF
jgi:hypothetical protein